MSERILEFEVQGLLKLQLSGRNDGRVGRYLKRIGKTSDAPEALVRYTSSVAGNWSFSGQRHMAVGLVEALPVFFETRYFVRCDFTDERVRGCRVVHEMAAVEDAFDFTANTLVGTLDFVNAPGKFKFHLEYDRGFGAESLVLEFMVVSEKLDVVRDYDAIVRTIEGEAPGLVHAFLSKSKGGAGCSSDGRSDEAMFCEIFQNVAEAYRNACRWVMHNPHLKYVAKVRYLKADKIRRWTSSLANSYANMEAGRREKTHFRSEEIEEEVDTVENRFVLFTLKTLSRRLETFALLCRENRSLTGENFTRSLEMQAEELSKMAQGPFFRKVGRFTGFKQESLALQRKRGYAEIYVAWLNLQKSLDATGEGLDVGHRPISALYEFWCFLTMKQMLEARLSPGRLVFGEIGRLGEVFEDPYAERDEGQTLGKLAYEFAADGRAVQLTYQQSYGKSGEEGNLAYLNPQRPDIVLTIRDGQGGSFTYLFDAKYRVSTVGEGDKELDMSKAETINDMHRYRDAILYRAQEGGTKLSRQVIGAYVLYPGRPKPRSYDYESVIATENIGAIELLPGDEGSAALCAFLDKILQRKSAEEHLHSVIPTRGTHVFVGDGFTEADLFDTTLPKGFASQFIFRPDMERFQLSRAEIVARRRTPEDIRFVRITVDDGAVVILRVSFVAIESDEDRCVYLIQSKEAYQ